MSFLQERVVGFHLERQTLSEGGALAHPSPGLIILYQRAGKYLDMFVCGLSNKDGLRASVFADTAKDSSLIPWSAVMLNFLPEKVPCSIFPFC
jgi:hypothetical protein